jgi:hypothetical protein
MEGTRDDVVKGTGDERGCSLNDLPHHSAVVSITTPLLNQGGSQANDDDPV